MAANTLTRIRVGGLFGLFDHDIHFPADWDFVILHGVNGVGKTKVLDLVKSALVGNVGRLMRLPFAQAELTFDTGDSLELTRLSVSAGTLRDPEAEHTELTMRFRKSGQRSVDTLDISGDAFAGLWMAAEDLERFTPLSAIDEDRYYDSSSGETLSSYEAYSRYADMVPLHRARRQVRGELQPVPSRMSQFWSASNVHLIEAQRLLRFSDTTRKKGGPERPRQMPTVTHFSSDLVDHIRTALGDLGRKSQELDRTFPSRLMRTTSGSSSAPSEAEVRRRYDEQTKLRRRLTRISVLDEFGADIKLPKQKLDDLILRVMVEFLKDSEDKFEVVEPLLDRLELLTGILNDRFQFKKLEIDRERGFVVRTDSGNEIRPSLLSSGEQHELVLLYDLLFGASDGALVLIDEPEISLHINWQKRFLTDMRKISGLTDHRFMVATHSPQVVGRFNDRMVRLAGGNGKDG